MQEDKESCVFCRSPECGPWELDHADLRSPIRFAMCEACRQERFNRPTLSLRRLPVLHAGP